MEAIVKITMRLKDATLGDAGSRNGAYGFLLTPLDHASIGRVDEDLMNAGGLPGGSLLAGWNVKFLEVCRYAGNPGRGTVDTMKIP